MSATRGLLGAAILTIIASYLTACGGDDGTAQHNSYISCHVKDGVGKVILTNINSAVEFRVQTGPVFRSRIRFFGGTNDDASCNILPYRGQFRTYRAILNNNEELIGLYDLESHGALCEDSLGSFEYFAGSSRCPRNFGWTLWGFALKPNT